MSYVHPAAAEHLRRRWLKPDWQRWMRPNAPLDVKRDQASDASSAEPVITAAEFDALQAQQRRIVRMLAELKYELAWRWLVRKYSPDQPRVPAGNGRESGRWTDGSAGQSGRDMVERLAGLERSRPRALLGLARKIIEAYRSDKGLWDLLGERFGTVSWTKLDGKDIFGSNSRSPTYTDADDRAARQMRDVLVSKYPER